MKHTIQKIYAVVATVALLLTANSFGLFAYAAGTGTAENPYQINTAAELQAINDNPSAHYILMANIDLNNVDFTPIGNADSGAFSGSFDGNGFTVSNLNVFSGKYAGLFGCNEGTIQNVTLSDIYVYGTRYVGGVVGENTAMGTVADCKVLGGTVESDGGLNSVMAGGICGANSGALEGEFLNKSNVTVVNDSGAAYAGGLVGYGYDTVTVTNSYNTGNISSSSYDSHSYSGGLVGCGAGSVTVTNSYNTGNISSFDSVYSYSGGLVGRGAGSVTVTNSYNTGNISSSSYYSYSGGLVGYGEDTVTVTNSYNTGNISFSSSSYYYYCSGGLVGYGEDTVTVTNSYNTGNISSSYYSYSGGLVGRGAGSVTVTNSYNTGNISSSYYSGGLVGLGAGSVTVTNSYTLRSAYRDSDSASSVHDGTYLYDAQMRNATSFVDWDFEKVWSMGGNQNSGFPVLKNGTGVLQLNVAHAVCLLGSTLQLSAYKNGDLTNDVTWSVTSGVAVVDKNGKMTASKEGPATVTATDSSGNKANCNIYVMVQNSGVAMEDFSIQQSAYGVYRGVSVGQSGDFLVAAESSDPSILQVTYWGGTRIHFLAKAAGIVTVSFETVQGFKGSCTATVTNYAESIFLPSSLTVARGTTKALTADVSPFPSSSKITWLSTNPNIAAVDQDGNVTGVSLGEVTVTAKTDNGLSAECTVTVNAPCKGLSFTEPYIVMEKDSTYRLAVVTDPVDATDSVRYSTSAYSSSLSVDSTGLVTAKAVGTYTVHAEANGKKASCTVRVVDEIVEAASISLCDTDKSVLLGDAFNLNAQIAPANVTDKTLIYTSEDSSVASIDENGNVTALSAGTTLLHVTAANGVSAVCLLTVRNVTEENGIRYFDIYTPQDLTLFSEYVNTKDGYDTLNARLCRDLDMSAECGESQNLSFAPIGSLEKPYMGCFAGNGFAIQNLYVSVGDYAGMFGCLGADAVVQNLHLEAVNINGGNYVGGVAGKTAGTIQAVSVSGQVIGGMYVGGVTGYNAGGTIDRCINAATLIGDCVVGGIAGYSRNVQNPGTISNAYSAAEITCSDYRVGGICGINDDTIQNCFFDSTLFGGLPIGFGANTSLSNSAKTTEEFKSGAVSYALNIGADKTVFYQTLGTDSYPMLDSTHKTVYYGYQDCKNRQKIYANVPLAETPAHHCFENGICTVCGAEQNIVIVESDAHAEGLSVGHNTAEFCCAELETDNLYIVIKNVNGTILTGEDLVGTGTTITYYDREKNTAVKTITVVLYGDVNGDGIIDELDEDTVMLSAVGIAKLENIWFRMAADVNRDTAIDGFDASQINLQIANKVSIKQK